MREKLKMSASWTFGLTLLFAAGMFMGGSRPEVSAQTEVLVQGRYLLIDKSKDNDARHYLIFDTQSGTLREWTGTPEGSVYTYEFDTPREIKLNATAIRR
jgi:hypothetical protein